MILMYCTQEEHKVFFFSSHGAYKINASSSIVWEFEVKTFDLLNNRCECQYKSSCLMIFVPKGLYFQKEKKLLKRVHLERKKKGGQKVLMMGGGTAPAEPTKSRTCHKFYGILKNKKSFRSQTENKREESLRGISLYLVWMLRARWKDFAAGLHANEAFLTGHTDTVCCTQRIFKKTTTNQSALSMCTRFY